MQSFRCKNLSFIQCTANLACFFPNLWLFSTFTFSIHLCCSFHTSLSTNPSPRMAPVPAPAPAPAPRADPAPMQAKGGGGANSDSEESSSEEESSSDEEGSGAVGVAAVGAAGAAAGAGGGGGGGGVAGGYDPKDMEHLQVSAEIRELFQYIQRYKPQDIELESKIKCFIPDYVPSVGQIDAFLKVPRPDGQPSTLGLSLLVSHNFACQIVICLF